MIKRVRLKNFKWVGDEPINFEMAPITVVIGGNSVGKSTLLQSLLLISQGDDGHVLPILTGNGRLVQLGAAGGLFHAHNASEMSIGLLVQDDLRGRHSALTLCFDPQTISQGDESRKIFHSTIACTTVVDVLYPIECDSTVANRWRCSRDDLTVGQTVLHGIIERNSSVILPFSKSEKAQDENNVHATLTRADVSITRGAIAEAYEVLVLAAKKSLTGVSVTEIASDLTVDLASEGSIQECREGLQSVLQSAWRAQRQLSNSLSTLSYLERVYYVGPNRQSAQRVYQSFGESDEWVGRTGANVATTLYASQGRCNEANRWLKLLGFDGQVQIEPVGSHESLLLINYTTTDRQGRSVTVGLPDIGVGISHVLPILAQLLSSRHAALHDPSKPAPLTLLEQPELHLHPAAQFRLAGILADAIGAPAHAWSLWTNDDVVIDNLEQTYRSQQIVVETHSEHLVNGLRHLVREGILATSDVIFVVLEATPNGAVVHHRRVERDGKFDEIWPTGFFSPV